MSLPLGVALLQSDPDKCKRHIIQFALPDYFQLLAQSFIPPVLLANDPRRNG